MGRGVDAAALMGRYRNAFRAYAYDCVSPGEIVRRLVRHADDAETMVTLACVSLDPYSGEIAYSCAGHPPPLLVTGDTAERDTTRRRERAATRRRHGVVDPRGSARPRRGSHARPLLGRPDRTARPRHRRRDRRARPRDRRRAGGRARGDPRSGHDGARRAVRRRRAADRTDHRRADAVRRHLPLRALDAPVRPPPPPGLAHAPARRGGRRGRHPARGRGGLQQRGRARLLTRPRRRACRRRRGRLDHSRHDPATKAHGATGARTAIAAAES